MYDGYYIYSPYKNTWDEKTIEEQNNKTDTYKETDKSYKPTYQDGDNLYGLKPYVYYSCRYKKGKIDVVITYSLDNYIQIQGTIDEGKSTIGMYGYVMRVANSISDSKNNGGVYCDDKDNVYYNGVKIETEKPGIGDANGYLRENVFVNGEKRNDLPYIKKNGIKYYFDQYAFSVVNGKAQSQSTITENDINNNNNAKKYYQEAYKLSKFIKESSLNSLTTNDIVDDYADGESSYYSIDNGKGKIFDFDNIESEDSNFNTHRIDVIKKSIERNLSVAISNYNNYSGVRTNFQMPKLKDTDWDKITDNISIISFFQGANIGGKVYNGYSIITNNKNEDVVMEDSIYIKTRTGAIHRITDANLNFNAGPIGIFNVDLEKRSDGNEGYYLPITGTLSYDSIVTQNNIAKLSNQSLREYIISLDDKLKKVYYTALGRERYGLYRPQLWIQPKVASFTMSFISLNIGESKISGPVLPMGVTFKSISYKLDEPIASLTIINETVGTFLIKGKAKGQTRLKCTITNNDGSIVTRETRVQVE